MFRLPFSPAVRGVGIEVVRAAPWRSQLTLLTLLGAFEELHGLVGAELAVPRFAIAEVGYGDRPAGWRFTLDRIEAEPRLLVSLAGFSDTSNRTTLGEQLERLVDVRTLLVRSALWQPTEDDVTLLSRSGRGISLA